MDPIISKNRGWTHIRNGKYSFWYAGNVSTKQLLHIKSVLISYDKSKLEILKKLLEEFKGNFSIIFKNKSLIFAAVDKIKSIPIFIGKLKKNFLLSNYAPNLLKFIDTKEKNNDALLSLIMAGYTIGRMTLYKNILQLSGGEICIIKNNNLKIEKYYSFIEKKNKYSLKEENFKNKLSSITLSIIEKILKKNKGRQIAVPLSAGYDSRLIVSALRELNYENVICISYGRKNNYESKISRQIADQLKYKWYFVDLNNKKQRENFKSKLYYEYKLYSDTLSSFSYVQDFFVLKELLQKKIINKNSLMLNGNTGDFISGGHLPDINQFKNYEKMNESEKIETILENIISKHFMLWDNFFEDKQKERIKSLIESFFPKNFKSYLKNDFYKIFEYLEFYNRQCNYVIQGQRVYDFFGLKWELPLWSDEYLEFWKNIPYELKYKQKLYKDMLVSNNWGGVWKNIEVNKKTISPVWMRYLRNFLKVFFLFNDRKKWKSFDKKYLAYWMETNPHYPYFDYLEIICDQRGARNSVAWHVESYINGKGLLLDDAKK